MIDLSIFNFVNNVKNTILKIMKNKLDKKADDIVDINLEDFIPNREIIFDKDVSVIRNDLPIITISNSDDEDINMLVTYDDGEIEIDSFYIVKENGNVVIFIDAKRFPVFIKNIKLYGKTQLPATCKISENVDNMTVLN